MTIDGADGRSAVRIVEQRLSDCLVWVNGPNRGFVLARLCQDDAGVGLDYHHEVVTASRHLVGDKRELFQIDTRVNRSDLLPALCPQGARNNNLRTPTHRTN